TANAFPEWTPDGKRLVFRSSRTGHAGIWWQPADGSAPAEALVQRQDFDLWDAVISPDGRYLVYAAGSLPQTGIYYRALTGDTTTRALVFGMFRAGSARISPDGKWLVYTSSESGSFEVYLRPFPSGTGRTVVSIDGGVEPLWSRDGRTVFYLHTGQLIAAS